MKKSYGLTIVFLIFSSILIGCGPKGDGSAGKDSLREPKSSISYQFELLKAGEAEKLKECFTPRMRERITEDLVNQGKTQANAYTLDDLVASVEMGEEAGQKTAKIKMKNGRTLTTLVQTDGIWLADTVWFK
jgi:hypothetical protein